MGIQTSLDAMREADRLVDALRLADDLAFEANREGGARTIRLLSAALGDDDQIAAIAAVHALAQVFDEQADAALSRALSSDRAYLREHAALALGSRPPRLPAIGRLIAMIVDGGFRGMLAQNTLEKWAGMIPDEVGVGVESALVGVREPGARARLVETLGLVRSRLAAAPLLRFAADALEPEAVRVAAVAALGQRHGDERVTPLLDGLASESGYLADVARLALTDLTATRLGRSAADAPLTAVQLFLHADIDPSLTQAGRGDNGGIATLLVRLGDALVTDDSAVERVITLSRGSAAAALASVAAVSESTTGHVYGVVPLLSEPVASAGAWPLRVAARRGIRRILRAAGTVDVLHLRMGDVGSLAAADVARELDIPVVFTVAPDPHGVINSLDRSGQLTRENFGEIDAQEHFWFRAHLVQSLAANAAHSVLFPRPELGRDMKELVGIDITARPERHTIVPEGIDIEVVTRSVADAAAHAAGAAPSPQLAALRELLSQLPAERRELPLVVSVGRFHRVKGMAAIVEAWGEGPARDRANLLLIGGDLADPSADEREQLEAIDAVIPADSRAASGLLLSGHRPNDTVAHWVAAARFGVPGLAAPRGIYVCGSVKEEFGIALLEAMATGLLVVAPDGGGPATYVEPGVTGLLTQTWDIRALREAISAAVEQSSAETTDDRADASRRMVEGSFTIQAMATALGVVYGRVHRDEADLDARLVAMS